MYRIAIVQFLGGYKSECRYTVSVKAALVGFSYISSSKFLIETPWDYMCAVLQVYMSAHNNAPKD